MTSDIRLDPVDDYLTDDFLNTGLGLPQDEPEELPEEDEEQTLFGAFIQKYRHDPVLFCREILDVEPFPWQVDAMNRISGPKPVRRLSIRSGHGTGKSCCVSLLTVHKLCTSYPVKIICTAPSAATLESGLMPEIKSWFKRLPQWLQDNFEIRSDRIMLKADPDAAFIQARTSSQERPEALAGIHSDNVLIVVDEASGVPENVFEAAQGSMSSEGSQTVLISNPTRQSGYFHRSQTDLAGTVWDTMHISCLDVPEKVASEFIAEMLESYGPEHPQFFIRVLGEFPKTDESSLIPAELVDAAMCREIFVAPDTPIVYGLDPARMGGDRAVLCKRKGDMILAFKIFRKMDLMELVGHVVHEAKLDRPQEICVDSIGLGAGVSDRLRELGYNVRDVNVSESAAMNPGADRLRDELWDACKSWLAERNCYLPPDKVLREELCAPTYTFTSAGKLKVESKDSMRKRLRRSPDMADSLCLTFASQACGVGGRAAKWLPGVSLRRGIKGV